MTLFLKPLYRYILYLSVLNIFILGSGYFIRSIINTGFLLSDVLILSFSFSIITVISLIIFFRGQNKEPESQTLHSLVAIVLKFLFEMGLAILWFIVMKKTLPASVYLFFVIYLTLTLFLASVVLKTLKNKSL